MIEANAFTNRVSTDYRYRTVLFAVPGLFINMIFAVFNGVVAVIGRSPWLGTLSAYYIILSVMRFSAVNYERKISGMKHSRELMLREAVVCRNCGILFTVMTIVLSGAVILLANYKGGKNYPGFTIFAVAAYTFCKIIAAIVNMVKVRKWQSPLLISIRNIGYVDACVSVLTLQNAMFASFGEGAVEYEKMMSRATGAVVCVMVLAIGIHSIVYSAKIKRKLKEGSVNN